MADGTAAASRSVGVAHSDVKTAINAAVALADVVVSFRVAVGTYTAVDRATLTVGDGEFVAIVGPTGCGKSTLLNIAAGLLAPAAGSVNIFGSPLSAPQPSGGLPVPGRCALSMEDRDRQRGDRARDHWHADG